MDYLRGAGQPEPVPNRNGTEELKAPGFASEQLVHLAKLASIGQLLSGAGHEINNALTVVSSYSELLLERTSDEPTREDLRIIYDQVRRIVPVVHDLLRFAPLRQSEKRLIDILHPCETALKMLSFQFRLSSIQVIRELPRELPLACADDRQMAQVFVSLLINAEQAMAAAGYGGLLRVRASVEGGHVRVTLQDDGPGVPAEHLEKIFLPLFTTRAHSGGTGLGLSICRGILEEHGGRIWVDSIPEQGAAFHVELPIHGGGDPPGLGCRPPMSPLGKGGLRR